MKELITKLKKILLKKFPNYSNEEIEKIIEDYGKIAILQTLDESIELLKNEEHKYKLGNLISDGNLDQAFDFAEKKGVDMINIFERIAKEIVVEIFER
jgi:hypothetical protein